MSGALCSLRFYDKVSKQKVTIFRAFDHRSRLLKVSPVRKRAVCSTTAVLGRRGDNLTVLKVKTTGATATATITPPCYLSFLPSSWCAEQTKRVQQ